MQQQEVVAAPPAESVILTHGGQAVDERGVFPSPPPAEIGALRSRSTNVFSGKFDLRGWASALFYALVLGPFLAGYCLAYVLHLPLAVMMTVGIVVGIGVFCMFIPWPKCSYVGENGIARCRVVRGQKKEEMFLFSSDCSVGMQATRMYVRGIYTGTQYTYTFYNSADKRKFKVEGRYYDWNKKIPLDNDWHFGNQGEQALVQFLLPRSLHRLDQGETELFALSSGMKIALTPESIVFEDRGKRNEIRYTDLENVSVNSGTVSIRERGGRSGFLGIGQKGVFSFSYSAMPNAQLFFRLLQRQLERVREMAGR